MRAISLWQPWASAIATGAKTIETRDWPTKYRGPLAIHATKRRILSELADFDMDPEFGAALGTSWEPMATWLPFGAIVAVCDLVECRPTEMIPKERLYELHHREGFSAGWREGSLGDFTPGRFGWVLSDVRPLTTPLPFKGSQGFFDVPDSFLVGAT